MTEEEEWYDLICFMVTSARGLVDEPKNYCPARMMDAVEKLLNLLKDRDIEKYEAVRKKIEKENFFDMEDDELSETLDEIVEMLL
ncbi:MAG: DUF6092 family protein [Candidatus Natronoplasma sp.]